MEEVVVIQPGVLAKMSQTLQLLITTAGPGGSNTVSQGLSAAVETESGGGGQGEGEDQAWKQRGSWAGRAEEGGKSWAASPWMHQILPLTRCRAAPRPRWWTGSCLHAAGLLELPLILLLPHSSPLPRN